MTNSAEHGDTGRGPENFDPVENLLGEPDQRADRRENAAGVNFLHGSV